MKLTEKILAHDLITRGEPVTAALLAQRMKLTARDVRDALNELSDTGVLRKADRKGSRQTVTYTLVRNNPLRMAWRKKTNAQLGISPPSRLGVPV